MPSACHPQVTRLDVFPLDDSIVRWSSVETRRKKKCVSRHSPEHGLQARCRTAFPRVPSPVPPVSSVVKNFAFAPGREPTKALSSAPPFSDNRHNRSLLATRLSQRHLRLNLIFTLAPASCGPCEVRLREKYLWRYK